MRVGVGVGLLRDQQALCVEVGDDVAGKVMGGVLGGAGVAAALPAEPLAEDSELVDRVDDCQAECLAEREVLLSAARGDVDDAGALDVRDLVPRDHAMRDAGGGRQLVEGPGVGEVHQVRAVRLTHHRCLTGDARLRAGRDPPTAPVVPLHELVGERGMDGRGHIAGQRPRGGGPHQQVLALVAVARDRQAQDDRQVLDVRVALGGLHVADAGPAARAPRHDVVAAV